MLENSQILILSFDPDSKIMTGISYLRYELGEQIPKIKEIYFGAAILEESNQINLPVFTCENSTEAMTVIELSQGNKTEIIDYGSCIKITAQSDSDMVKVKDRLLYFFMGVEIDEQENEEE